MLKRNPIAGKVVGVNSRRVNAGTAGPVRHGVNVRKTNSRPKTMSHEGVMERAQRQSILIVEPDAQFREELYNFLLSAGYERVDSAENYENALEKISKTEYDVLLVAGSPAKAGLTLADDIAASSPKSRLILLVGSEEQREVDPDAGNGSDYQYLIKAVFERNLLYLLDKGT